MLKIKDNINLKELEKFGFYQSNEHMNSWDYELKIKKPERENNFSENGFATLTVSEYDIDGKTYHGLYSLILISNASRIAGFNNIYNINVAYFRT